MFKNKFYTKFLIVVLALTILLSLEAFWASKMYNPTETVNFTNTYGKSLNSLVFHLYADSYGSIKTIPSLDDKKKIYNKGCNIYLYSKYYTPLGTFHL